jgi:hypothetical protein
VREDAILPHLDAWLASQFTPTNFDATVAALAAAHGDGTTRAQIEPAEAPDRQRVVVECSPDDED